jgi:glucokinase
VSGVSRDALILAGDIGGTHTRFALVAVSTQAPQEPRTLAHEDLASVLLAERGSLEDAAGAFLARAGRGTPDALVMACAGPVRGGESRITNLPWVVREDALRAATGATHVRVVNDFEAMARGTLTLHEHELEVLQQGERDPHGARLVLGAGTGLGQAWVLASPGTRPRVLTSEGGHVSFAPRDAFEDGLLVALRARYGRVSVERVVSGLGLVHLYEHIVDTGVASTTEALRLAVARDGARAVGEAQEDAAATLAVQRFASLYGAHAGDAALSLLPRGGVVLTGGLSAALLPTLRHAFVPAFLDKGRLRPALEPVHVAVALSSDTGMRGAIALAIDMLA